MIRLSRLARLLAASGALCLSGQALAAPTDPTAGVLTPAEIDHVWQAAVAKYAPERQEELARIDDGDLHGPFRPDWGSLEAYKPPQWYQDAKFGIFIHWGVYSVAAYGNEWYPRNMYAGGADKTYRHHVATWGPTDRFGYKDLIPRFKAEHWDPDAWAKLFRDAGARYVVPVAEHHDGFAMYDSRLSDWTAAKMGPRRDLIGDLATAVRAEGLHFGVSFHRAEHDWFFETGRKISSDVNDPAYAALYGPAQVRLPGKTDDDLQGEFTPVSQAWLDDWTARAGELVDLYHPDLVYFDWWIGHPTYRNTLPRFLAYYYNSAARRGEAGVVNYKFGAFPESAGVLDIERGQLPKIEPRVWQTCTSISDKSWGYIDNDTYKPPRAIIHLLADVVSKNGNLLLNVGPRADGTIPDAARDTLLAIGGWLKANGEGIYGTRPWRVFGEGPTQVVGGSFQEGKTKPYTAEDFRFTTKGKTLYAIELGWPGAGEAVIHALTAQDHVRSVVLLADGAEVKHRQDADGLHLFLPKTPVGDYAYVYRIELN
jgi:alpha-L-fucosidase